MGKIKFTDIILSKRKIAEAIKEGKYSEQKMQDFQLLLH